MSVLQLTVNGKPMELDVPESRYLAEVLRYDLGLTGTKIGCNEAECGICTVLVDGVPVNSCIYPAFRAQGAEITTIEGIGTEDCLHPLQQAFLEHGAIQCGFCTPGLIMTAKALIDSKKAASEAVTEEDIKAALKDTYCRCTGYQSVINAILQASGQDVPPYIPETRAPHECVGKALWNPDALKKITGQAKYTDDYHFPGMLYARTKRAGIPHGRIMNLDVSAAEALPGVRAVITHRDVPGRKNHGLVTVDWPVLCYDKVRYVGDAVAVVAADTRNIAEEALDLIRVEYEPLPVVEDCIQAAQLDAPIVHDERPDGNLLKHIKVRKGDIARGFDEADLVVERTYRTPQTEQMFLEPECSIGVPRGYDPSQFGGHVEETAERGIHYVHPKTTIYCGTQIPYLDRDQTAAALGVPVEDIRIVATLMGGGFGGKEDIAAQIHVALLAEKTQRPVKMLYTRAESLLFHPKRHATVIRIKTGARKDGRLVAVEAELYGDGGAYASLSEKVMSRATTHASGPYDVPHVSVDCYAMYTNNTPSGAFRGFGVTQSCFAVESNMDQVAEALGLDPFELRRINALDIGATTCTGQVLRESVGLKECIDLLQADMRAHHDERGDAFKWSWSEGTKQYGWGLAVGYKNTGLGGGAPDKASAMVEAWTDADGRAFAEVRTSSAEMGQGLPAVLAACAAEELGLPYERVRVLLGDTDHCPDGGPTTASRQTYVSGNAARHAARQLREQLAARVSSQWGCAPDEIEFKNGTVVHGDSRLSLGSVLARARDEGCETKVEYEYWAPKTQPLGTGGDMHVAFGFGAQAALVEVDTETGAIQVLKLCGAHDVGRAINPLTLEGQIEGGMIMGLGNALTEHYVMEAGAPWTNVMARYKMPGIKHTPRMISRIVEHGTADGPYGAKGIGELSSIPTSPAITNAVYNAVGVRLYSLPADQDALLLALKAGRKDVDMGWGDYTPIPTIPDRETIAKLIGV